jgi:CHAT domain-containing protein
MLGVSVQSPDIRLGNNANEYDVKTLDLTVYRYLHFATHGVLAGDIPYLKQPALVLSQVGNLKGEDGFLTMEEVLDLKLAADLTVLSACQTALGQEISGEGIMGLMRAFLYAGSRSVIVSLWNVEDESTATLMATLYSHVAKGLPLAEALRRAKEDLRKYRDGRFAHPFYWAPFIIFGSD